MAELTDIAARTNEQASVGDDAGADAFAMKIKMTFLWSDRTARRGLAHHGSGGPA
jgi:hypothetical protein